MAGDLLVQHWVSLHTLVTALALGIYFMASHALRQRRHPAAALAWCLSLALIPYIAFPLYLLIGNRKVVRGQPAQGPQGPLVAGSAHHSSLSRFQNLASSLGLPPASTYDSLVIHGNGSEARLALLALVDNAQHSLDLCTFILGNDMLGNELIAHLVLSAARGVKVRLMIDGVGVYLGGHPNLRRLQAAGVRVVRFIPVFSSARPGRTNLRNHRKMVVADAYHVWLGGRNFAAEYFEGDAAGRPQKTCWVDLSFVLCGAVARQALDQFNKDWLFATQEAALAAPSAVPQPGHKQVPNRVPQAQLLPSGPDQSEDTVYTLLVSSCFSAQNRILAVSPYFVPDATLQMALTLAARRGVAVDLVLPRRSNHRLADMARSTALRELAAAGARVWLLPDMIHAKAIVIDDDIAMAGSANLDERSLFLNYELMLAFYEATAVRQFSQWIEQQRVNAQLYEARPPGTLREVREGLVRWLAFQL